MSDKSTSLMFFVLLIAVCISLFNTKVNGQRAHLVGEMGNGPVGGRAHAMRSLEGEITDRVESQLLGALELLQTYQDGASLPAKFAEKRRNNKFEFIRFGRRRR